MDSEKCWTCDFYDRKTGKCSYWEVGCFYIEEDEEDSDDSGDEQYSGD